MDHWTLIVMPDEHSRVRRYRVPVVWLKRGPWLAAALALAILLLGADWVRLRVQAVDVAELREASEVRSASLVDLGERLEELEGEFERVRAFERKVRVIADLPSAVPDAAYEPPRDGGQGGPDPEWGRATLPLARLEARPGLADESGLAGVESRRARLAWAVGTGRRSLEDLVEGLEGKSDLLAATPSIWPTDGWVTSRFGWRTSPFTGRRQLHSGLDIAAGFGTPIIAPAQGRVTFVGKKGPLGRAIVIDHGHGVETTYGHAQEIFVERGEQVARGTRIAAVGSSGRSTGPHLHYAVEVRGENRDPMRYIVE